MKRFALLGLAAAVLISTPAMAQNFTGPRVGANIGYAGDGVEDAFTWAGNIGYDMPISGAIAGVTFEYGDSDETGRDLAAIGRIGLPVQPDAMIYGLAGYTNLNAAGFNWEGVRFGGGIEVAFNKVFVNAEYRRSDYDSGLDTNQGVVGIGVRF